jgi:C4-dicarboxylate transporter DctQ subunit
LHRLTRLVEPLMKASRLLLGALLLFSIALNFANVLARYLFLSPLNWAEEVMTFILLWCVFLGAALVTWNDEHLRMSILSDLLPPKWQQALRIACAVCMAGILIFLLVLSVRIVALFIGYGQKAAVTELPIAIPHLAIPAGFALMLLAILARRGRPDGTG